MTQSLLPTTDQQTEQQDREPREPVHSVIRKVLGLITQVAGASYEAGKKYDQPMQAACLSVVYQIEQQLADTPGMDATMALVRKALGVPAKATKAKKGDDSGE